MPTTIDGSTGVSQVQDNTVSTPKLVNNAVTPAKTQAGALPSMVRVNTSNGQGSTATAIRRFTNIVTNQGSDITYVDSATLGGSFTINTSGVYSVSYSESMNGPSDFGISLNASSLTVSSISLPNAEQLTGATGSAANYAQGMAWTGYLSAGSVIRAQTTAGTGSGRIALFTIVRVS